MKISVVIPTYRRPNDLQRCLTAFKQQTRPADEIWVIVRDTDTETATFLETFAVAPLPLHIAKVQQPGVIAAMNLGLEQVQGDIVAFTDDDAAPHDDWLSRIEDWFRSDPQIGGVGGRDWVYHGSQLEAGSRPLVGRVQWFGRVIGNHHLGAGPAREVDILKGVNMSFRQAAIRHRRFEQRLEGSGAQVHFEIFFSLALKQAGWKLIYDPQIGVDHFRGQRFDEDQRDKFNRVAFRNAVHNETLALLEYLPTLRRAIFLLWSVLIGTREAVGLAQWLRLLPQQKAIAGQKLWASLQGRWLGLKTWQSSQH